MTDSLRSKILETLSQHHMMTLATVRPDGFPQATIVNYINEDLTLYFVTDAMAQKAGNIDLNSKVSVAISSETKNFYKLRGLSLSGHAKRVVDQKKATEIALRLFQTLPQSRRFVPEPPQQTAVYAVTPVAISLIDYAEGFGKSELLEL